MTSSGHQLLVTSWSSHCTLLGVLVKKLRIRQPHDHQQRCCATCRQKDASSNSGQKMAAAKKKAKEDRVRMEAQRAATAARKNAEKAATSTTSSSQTKPGTRKRGASEEEDGSDGDDDDAMVTTTTTNSAQKPKRSPVALQRPAKRARTTPKKALSKAEKMAIVRLLWPKSLTHLLPARRLPRARHQHLLLHLLLLQFVGMPLLQLPPPW
mmetsp:Transcript_25336/g.59344  ORF Transcript_25336/g.59344 Transcript_25336/m.59344 type:complete len:210 (-) Transcript_25336:1973-2602(-)